jgi:hypothetical protein
MFSRSELILIKQRALRKGTWFRVLNRTERAIISLTIRCVDKVRSSNLAEILRSVVDKLVDAVKSRVKRLMENIGRELALNLSRIAKGWSYAPAVAWGSDSGFMQYLAITHMNTFKIFKSPGGHYRN